MKSKLHYEADTVAVTVHPKVSRTRGRLTKLPQLAKVTAEPRRMSLMFTSCTVTSASLSSIRALTRKETLMLS